jgi:hypothetical protein
MAPINDPPPTLADLSKAMWHAALGPNISAVVLEHPEGQFKARASRFDGKTITTYQSSPQESFRDAASAALLLARSFGAVVDPARWHHYFRG